MLALTRQVSRTTPHERFYRIRHTYFALVSTLGERRKRHGRHPRLYEAPILLASSYDSRTSPQHPDAGCEYFEVPTLDKCAWCAYSMQGGDVSAHMYVPAGEGRLSLM